MKTRIVPGLGVLLLVAALVGCSDDDGPGAGLSEAQLHGVGAACEEDADCFVDGTPLSCLPFKGGYCGLAGCQQNADCPLGSGCIVHEDGSNYCFLLCTDKPQCNYTRPPAIEANCASKLEFVDGGKDSKACVPPS